jgi:tetratricopeptide (TPR) repeat protein
MKNIFLVLMMVAISGAAFSQGAKVQSAVNYLKQNDLKKAKLAIDAASVHPKTSSWPKTWVNKGKIYYAIAVDTTPQLNDIREGAIFVAEENFKKAKKSPDSRTDMNEVHKYLYILVYNEIYNKGVGYYRASDYDNASKHFAACAGIREVYDELDTASYYNAANAAAANNKPELAITYYDKIKASGYENGAVYSRIAGQYKALGDSAKAIEAITEGRTAFPENQALLISEFNIYVEMGETEKAISNIDKAIAANPDNAAYYYVRGKLKESMEVPDNAGAETDYKKAIEIDPEHLDANHDLGAMYVRESTVIVDAMNALPYSDTKGYDKKKLELDAVYLKALPYLRKAYELDPSDTEVQTILKQLYLRSKDMDNYNKIQQDIDAAKGGE